MCYVGFSMSERAAGAYREGLRPASKLAKELRVSTDAVRAVLTAAEWHHTSSRFNRTDFYSFTLPEDLDDEEDRREAQDLLDRMKAFDAAAKAAKAESQSFRARVTWLNWSGTRNHPKADEQTAITRVTLKGKCYTIEIENPNGGFFKPFRKFEGTNGFNVERI